MFLKLAAAKPLAHIAALSPGKNQAFWNLLRSAQGATSIQSQAEELLRKWAVEGMELQRSGSPNPILQRLAREGGEAWLSQCAKWATQEHFPLPVSRQQFIQICILGGRGTQALWKAALERIASEDLHRGVSETLLAMAPALLEAAQTRKWPQWSHNPALTEALQWMARAPTIPDALRHAIGQLAMTHAPGKGAEKILRAYCASTPGALDRLLPQITPEEAADQLSAMRRALEGQEQAAKWAEMVGDSRPLTSDDIILRAQQGAYGFLQYALGDAARWRADPISNPLSDLLHSKAPPAILEAIFQRYPQIATASALQQGLQTAAQSEQWAAAGVLLVRALEQAAENLVSAPFSIPLEKRVDITLEALRSAPALSPQKTGAYLGVCLGELFNAAADKNSTWVAQLLRQAQPLSEKDYQQIAQGVESGHVASMLNQSFTASLSEPTLQQRRMMVELQRRCESMEAHTRRSGPRMR